jgi:hypothetical protein
MTFPRKVLWFALAGTGCLALSLLVLLPKPRPGALDLRIIGQPQMTNGTMFISIVLSNGTSRTLHVVDDGVGRPFMVLDAGAAGNAPGSIGTALRILANTLKLSLAPGTALTDTVQVTNAPPRFRLHVKARDLSSEPRRGVVEHLRRLAEKARLRKPTPPRSLGLLSASPWIVNGNISTMTQTAAENIKETPTNGLSQ